MFLQIENVPDQVVLFRPVYSSEGNITEILLNSSVSEVCFDVRNAHSCRFALARFYAIDLAAQEKAIKRTFHRSVPVPFYLPDGRVFVPLKMRTHSLASDNSYGYVDIGTVKPIREADNQTWLELTTDHRVPLFTSINTARSMLYLGHEIQQTYFPRENSEVSVILDAVKILLSKLSHYTSRG